MIVVNLHVKKEIEPTAYTIESSIVIGGLNSSQTYMLPIGVATDSGNNLGDVSETGIYHINASRSAILICWNVSKN